MALVRSTKTQSFVRLEDLVYSVFKVLIKKDTHFVFPSYKYIIRHTFCMSDENQILPDTGVTVAQEKRWTKEQEGLLLRATDLYSSDVNYNQIEADRKALRKQYPDDSEDED